MSIRAIPRIVVVIAVNLLALIALFASDAIATRVNYAPAADSCFATLGDITQFSSADASAVQQAVDAAQPNDTVKVAGICQGVQMRAGVTQTVYISKSLTLQGGYTTTNWTTSDPGVNPTTLDAQSRGRVIYVTGEISPTVENLRITNGNATGLGGHPYNDNDVGGGVYVITATATLSHNYIFNNTAGAEPSIGANGGGLYLGYGPATLIDNIIVNNTANRLGEGGGGGLFLYHSPASLVGNSIISNTASTTSIGRGGGVYLVFVLDSPAIFQHNLIQGNVASVAAGGTGGGVAFEAAHAVMSDDTIISNTASVATQGSGGGLYVFYNSQVAMTSITIRGNTASAASSGEGGGLYIDFVSGVTLKASLIQDNIASTTSTGKGGGLYAGPNSSQELNDTIVRSNFASESGPGYGGGLYLYTSETILDTNLIEHNIGSITSDGEGGGVYILSCTQWPQHPCGVTLNANTIVSNTASLNPAAMGRGGGLYVTDSDNFSLINNIVANNYTHTQGAGLWLSRIPPYYQYWGSGLMHNTIVSNTGSGDGVFIGISTTLTFVNTILSNHADVGITVTAGSSITLRGTLWYANGANTGGAGTLVTGTVNIYGDPKFMDPANHDYHLLPGSAARDTGIDAGVTTDIDGDFRPQGRGFDLGADEYVPRIMDLHFSGVLTDSHSLTATLRWTAPIDAVSYTLRYSATSIDDTNWENAASAPGVFVVSDSRMAAWTTTVPYTGGIIYFTVKFKSVDATLSEISNNAFWPYRNLFLPLLVTASTTGVANILKP